MSKTNLLSETLEFLGFNQKTPADVRWVCVDGEPARVGTWADFERLADFDYDSGYGGNEVAGSLVIVGDGWWLERGEYDGSEWWNFKQSPKQPDDAVPLRAEDLHED